MGCPGYMGRGRATDDDDRMSRIAADVWAEAGYTNLYNLEGGFVAWEDSRLPAAADAPG